MKIILLPGLDGTGLLFEPLISVLPNSYKIIVLPAIGEQTYESIYVHIKPQLPNEAFYVIAESFSGPIAARIAMEDMENLKGIIFVATFLSSPSVALVRLAKFLPLKTFLKLPFSRYFIRRFLLGSECSANLFIEALSKVSAATLKSRLCALEDLSKNPIKACSTIRALYLCASSDWLVSKRHVNEFVSCFPNISISYVQGTHFLLQSNPVECAKNIRNFTGI